MTTDVAGLLDLLVAHGWTVACAESLTGGLVCARLVDVPGASRAVRGGVVAYQTELKAELLGVDRDLLAEHGAVHPRVAEQMAGGVAARLGATFGVATTGVAGPAPEDGHAPGTVFVGLAGPGGSDAQRLSLTGDRAGIRAATVDAALAALGRLVRARADGDPAAHRAGTHR